MPISNQATSLLNAKQCDSVQCLTDTRKAIYIMRSNMDLDLYRFGGIGVSGTKSANTALKRLGQCVKVVEGEIADSWHYLVIAKLSDTISTEEVKHCESILRQKLIGKSGRFESNRVPRKDAFRTRDVEQVLKLFRQAAKQFGK